MHPLVGDLSGLTDTEVNDKFNELQKRLNAAYRFGSNDMVTQIRMMLENYQSEIARRQKKMLDEIAEKSAEFKSIIDIK